MGCGPVLNCDPGMIQSHGTIEREARRPVSPDESRWSEIKALALISVVQIENVLIEPTWLEIGGLRREVRGDRSVLVANLRSGHVQIRSRVCDDVFAIYVEFQGQLIIVCMRTDNILSHGPTVNGKINTAGPEDIQTEIRKTVCNPLTIMVFSLGGKFQ